MTPILPKLCRKQNACLFLLVFLLNLAVAVWQPSQSFAQGTSEQHTSITTVPSSWRLNTETLKLPGSEKMGMLGGNLLFDVSDSMRLGIGSYGAVRGERGGFITLGVAGELRQRLSSSWVSHTGLFVGAGGGRGGYTLSGGGLMLRGDIGLTYESAAYGNYGFGLSHVRFPSGVIASTQPYLQLDYPFYSLLATGWLDKKTSKNDLSRNTLASSNNEFAVVARNYRIKSGVVRDDGLPQHPRMALLGVEWLSYLDPHWFLKLESEGAMGGQSNGYMQILAGLGYRLPISDSTGLKFHLVTGPAGGGGVDTGGGLLFDAGFALQKKLNSRTSLELTLAQVRAPSRSFAATSADLKINYLFELPLVSARPIPWTDLGEFDVNHLRVRFANQTYLKADPQWRNRSVDESVSNLGVQLDYFLTPVWFLSGQGLAAYAGNAGAYMTGQIGVGSHWPVYGDWFVETEALLGAAGGGGLAVGGGLVGQFNGLLGYRISKDLSLMAGIGRINSFGGPMKANVMGLSLAYQFTGISGK